MTADHEAALAAYAAELADGIEAALPGWVERCVHQVMARPLTAHEENAVSVAGRAAQAEVGGRIRALLSADVDAQATTPLALLRQAVRYPAAVLEVLGASPAERDEFSRRAFPDDVYGLAPASFADLDPGLASAALSWGAAKAFVHKRRHSPPGPPE